MNPCDLAELLAEKAALERMLDETPAEDLLDRVSLQARIEVVAREIARMESGRRNDGDPPG